MNKKIIIVLIIGVIIALTGVGIFITKGNENDGTNSLGKNENYQESNADSKGTSNKSGAKYDLEFLEEIKYHEQIKGEVIDIGNIDDKFYVCTSNKVYYYNVVEFMEVINSTKDIKSIYLVGENSVILENSDNTYSFYFQNSYGEKFKTIDDIEIENTIYASYEYSWSGREIFLIKQEEGNYSIDYYSLDNNFNIETKALQKPLVVKANVDGKFQENTNIENIYVVDGSDLRVTLNDGKVYSIGGEVESFGNVKDGIISATVYAAEQVNDAKKVYNEGYLRPIYEKIGDKNNLYTYSDELPLRTIGTPDEKYKVTMPLPEGYTTDDIKKFIDDLGEMAIQFNDNSIYVLEDEENSKFEYNEELSKLLKDNKIKNMAIEVMDLVVLMDDGHVYKVKL